MAYGWILSIIMFIITYFCYNYAQEQLKQKQSTEQWIEAQAQVINIVDIQKKSDEDSNWLEIIIDYEYSVGGEILRGRGKREEHNMKKRQAKKVYEPGTPLTIFYDPNNHSNSQFSKGINPGDYIMYLFPIIFLIIGISLLGR